MCKREILIENGSASTFSVEGTKKPPKQVRAHISKPQDRKEGLSLSLLSGHASSTLCETNPLSH